jgi:hypothetical protein
MKRREAKFVHASPRMSPDQIAAAPRLREDRPRTTGKAAPARTAKKVQAGEKMRPRSG